MQSTKKIKPKDIMEFPWDNKGGEKQNRTKVIDDKVREELINRMKKIEKSSVGRPPRQGSIFE
jgi:hypothetical protein